MTVGIRLVFLVSLISLWLVRGRSLADDVRLQRVISHEDAKFDTARSRMTIGRDGRLYFAASEYLLRMERDGSKRAGTRMTAAMSRGTANADGVIGTGHGHFTHAVKVWRPDFSWIGEVSDFLNNDDVQYWSPCDLQAGTSGDFFGYDSNRNRIVRVSPQGKLVAAYALEAAGLNTVTKLARFRVWEPGERFYVRFEKTLTCVGFDGRLLWAATLGADGNPWDGWRDVFDVDDEGRVFVLTHDASLVKVFDKEGKAAGEVKLTVGDRKGRLADLAIWQDELFVKREDSAELCAVYDRVSGAFKRALSANTETLRATLPSVVWTAGAAVPIAIEREEISNQKTEPTLGESGLRLRVWLRPYNTPDFVELPLVDARVTVPTEASGLYQLRISPDVRGAASEYQLDAVVEVRVPNAKGSVSIFTPLNRLYYGNGEAVSVSVVTRSPYPDETPRQWRVLLRPVDVTGRSGPPKNSPEPFQEPVSGPASVQRPLFGHDVLVTLDRPSSFEIPDRVTRSLAPGRYLLTVDAPGFTVAPQYLVFGEGIETPPKFNLVQYGDYNASFPFSASGKPSPLDAPELVADHLRAARRLNLNLFADRIGLAGAGVKQHVTEKAPTDELFERLKADPLSVSPEKARVENTLQQTVAARGAFGQEQRGIFLMMDAGLPLGTGFDGRAPEQREKDLREVNEALRPYPAFRGWSWAANWWLGKTGEAAAKDDEQKKAFQAAMKTAKDSGGWSPVLDEVSDEVFSQAVNAEQSLRHAQVKVAPDKILLSTMTGPYRAVFTHPPTIFRNADEVDLHYQMEQIQPPSWTAHAVDFLKRPGKRAWGHPEIWNDDGTGGMLLPTLLPMALRGAEGVGWSGRPHDGTPLENDSRAGGPGLLTMLRSLNELLTIYGPWQNTLENRDRVAIVVSTRMQRISGWHSHLGSEYHEQLFEAYNACLYAHRPAKFVFVEDLKLDTFKETQAVLIVGQNVELDPPLVAALTDLKKTSPATKLYFDGTCREELVKDALPHAEPLGLTFDKLNKYEEELAQDDSLYARLPRWFFDHAMELKQILADVTPVAECNQPEVLLFERFSGDARFVWVLNNTAMLESNPGQAWRSSLMMSQRAAVVAKLDFKAGNDFVYDMFAFRKPRSPVDASASQFGEPVDTAWPFLADLRSSPVRLYAILPAKPHRMKLKGPTGNVPRGGDLEWSAEIVDADGKPINANIPFWLSVWSQDRRLLTERYEHTRGRDGASGRIIVPKGSGIDKITMHSAELLTPFFGLSTTRRIEPTLPNTNVSAAEFRFGPHFKEIAISADGRTGILNAFNWHENLFAFDLENGDGRWQQRLGDHFTFSPQAAGGGFVVQGFDKQTPEGYHLYLLNQKGEAARRFALFGLPKRATSWANGSHLLDRGINSFATAPDVSWVAAAGDLGFAVWSREGELKWSVRNSEFKSEFSNLRPRRHLFVPDANTLMTATGTILTAHAAIDGQRLWMLDVAPTGNITGGQLSTDGKTLVLKTDTDGGRIVIVRDHKIIGTIFTPADVALPTPDGRFVVVTHERQLQWYTAAGQLVWQFTGDEFLRNPTISADGTRIAVSSEMGILTTLNDNGDVLAERDLQALTALKFTKDGDLLAATWTGDTFRFTERLVPKWHRHLVPFGVRLRPAGEPPKPGQRDIQFQDGPIPDNRIWMGWPMTKVVPTTRMIGWGNSAPDVAPLTPNLLTETQALIHATSAPTTFGDPRNWKQPIEMLTDGKPDAPPRPWLTWSDINYIDSGWRQKLTLVVDTFREQLRVTGVTIVEDAAHPESWLRDVRLQWWDAASESWRDGPYLTWDAGAKTNTLDVATNAEFTPDLKEDPAEEAPRIIIDVCAPFGEFDAEKIKKAPKEGAAAPDAGQVAADKTKHIAHTHMFAQSIEAAKFRFVSTGGGTWPSGNLRMGELVFHGERLGASHPDVIAKKPLAVLFDEDESELRSSLKHGHNPQFDFLYDGAFSGGKALSLKNAGNAAALWRPPFGHAIPNWNFEIVESPQPGQYRWLQFAWKATSPKTTGIGLLIGRNYPAGGYAVTCGQQTIRDGAIATKQTNGPVPTEWQTVTIDLWSLSPTKPLTIQSLTLHSTGGGAAFDRIVLGQDEKDLPTTKQKP